MGTETCTGMVTASGTETATAAANGSVLSTLCTPQPASIRVFHFR